VRYAGERDLLTEIQIAREKSFMAFMTKRDTVVWVRQIL
jgi:hypothetical protein